jgi:prefoldin subunit 5
MSELDALQKKKEEADKIVNDIKSKSKTIEERIAQVNKSLKSVNTTDKEFQKIVQKLQQIQNESPRERILISTTLISQVRIAFVVEHLIGGQIHAGM